MPEQLPARITLEGLALSPAEQRAFPRWYTDLLLRKRADEVAIGDVLAFVDNFGISNADKTEITRMFHGGQLVTLDPPQFYVFLRLTGHLLQGKQLRRELAFVAAPVPRPRPILAKKGHKSRPSSGSGKDMDSFMSLMMTGKGGVSKRKKRVTFDSRPPQVTEAAHRSMGELMRQNDVHQQLNMPQLPRPPPDPEPSVSSAREVEVDQPIVNNQFAHVNIDTVLHNGQSILPEPPAPRKAKAGDSYIQQLTQQHSSQPLKQQPTPPRPRGYQPDNGGLQPQGSGQSHGNSMQSHGNSMQSHGNSMQSQGNGLQPQGSGLQPQGSGLQPQLSGVQPQLGGMPGGVQPQLSGMQPQLSGVQPQLSGMQSQLSGIQPQLSGVQPQLSGVQSQLGVQPQISGVQPQISGVQSQLGVQPQFSGMSQLSGMQPQLGLQQQLSGMQPQLTGPQVNVIQPQSSGLQSHMGGVQLNGLNGVQPQLSGLSGQMGGLQAQGTGPMIQNQIEPWQRMRSMSTGSASPMLQPPPPPPRMASTVSPQVSGMNPTPPFPQMQGLQPVPSANPQHSGPSPANTQQAGMQFLNSVQAPQFQISGPPQYVRTNQAYNMQQLRDQMPNW